MQICSRCLTQSADSTTICPGCQAEMREFSLTAAALRKFRSNPRVKVVRISVSADACPACQNLQGVYPKDQVPNLPIEGCSHSHGCRCFYDPVLEEIYP